ncbi:hypothetical protein RJ641_027073 [Dillenia turbinata]|uniref:CCR4-NOT transcription complex subunit 10 n=1 Tax=Dillenia turbinata TaxID=194707 RepID=A0AAN8W5I0_9MAGN
MDSRDSANANNREGSTDDDGLLSLTAGLAKDAALLFQSGKFGECVDVLNQLLQKKEDDPKVLHNIAIAEYFRDGCSDPRKLLEALNKVKKQSEELAGASGENLEASANTGNKITLGSKSTNISQNFSSLVYTDEFDTSVTILNMAIIWFHLHEYAKALSILEPLYQNIEPIDENTALDICLLLLDVALALHDASKSADVINYLEKAFGLGNMTNQNDNGNTSNQQSSNPVAKPPVRATSDASNSDSTGSANVSEDALSRTLSEETDRETLFSTLDIVCQNLSRTAGPPHDILRTPTDRSISISDLKFKLHLYKVRLLLLTRNLKTAKREVKMAMMNGARGRDSSMALLLKSQLEYARGNHRKAIKLLMASGNGTETGMTGIFFNNLGCIHYQLGKYHTSSLYFSRALSNSSSLWKDKPLKLSSFSQDKSLQIVYNSGVQYLACGKPILAANCFKKASLIFYDQPLLWLRIAECCLMAKEKGLLKSYGALPDASEIKVHVSGKGKWRHLVIDGVSRSSNVNSLEKDDWFSENGRQLILSLPLARRCLLDALHLLNSSVLKLPRCASPNQSTGENEPVGVAFKNSNHKTLSGSDSKAKVIIGSGQVNANGDIKEPKAGVSSISTLQSSISDYEDICRRENQMIKQAALADLAYVELELGNPLKALVAANSLLRLPGCSRIYIFIAHVYAAEALCLLSRPKEAAEHFSTYLSGGNNVELPYTEDDCEQWRTVKVIESDEMNAGSAASKTTTTDESQGLVFVTPEEARGILYTNFAVMSAVQGDLQQALTFATQALSILPNSSEAILTSVYVDLMLGKSQEALVKLKNCTRVRFVPSSLPLNGSSSSL